MSVSDAQFFCHELVQRGFVQHLVRQEPLELAPFSSSNLRSRALDTAATEALSTAVVDCGGSAVPSKPKG